MHLGIFGVKYNNSLKEFIKTVKPICHNNNVVLNKTYFDTSTKTDKKKLIHLYKTIKNILQKSDLILIENTEYSNGISFIIGLAVEMRKPVMVLYNLEKGKNPSLIVQSNVYSPYLTFKYYKETELKELIVDFIKHSRKLLNTKFIFSFSSEITKYLHWWTEHYNRPMVHLIRKLIHKKIKTDSYYQKRL